MKGGLWVCWARMIGGGNRGRGIMGMELQSGDSKEPLSVHMGGGACLTNSVSYIWMCPARKT